ncbi:MAG: protein TonB [Janthinobacterium sp.]|jgi:protein TonB
MLPFQSDWMLFVAIALSLLAHGVLLALHPGASGKLPPAPLEPALEVILVNAKHGAKPKKAEALAQANLDGGGNADAGRAKSPLPDLRKQDDGVSFEAAKRRIALLEQTRRDLLAQANRPSLFSVSSLTENRAPDTLPGGADRFESRRALARMAAEISQDIEDQNQRPRKTFITPSTQQVGYAIYYKAMQKRIEETGTLNFPQQGGRKLYGELIVYIPVFQDGTIYQKGGGAQIRKSSGNAALDAAALAIVRRAAPFGRFPPDMLSKGSDDLWAIITRFTFTREEKLEAKFSGELSGKPDASR